MKIKSHVKVGGPQLQHNQTVVKNNGLRIKSNVKAGPGGVGGFNLNHNQTVVRSPVPNSDDELTNDEGRTTID